MATLGLGLVAIALGIVFENINVAFMVALAFGIAASANFPVLFLSMFWSGLTTRGALAGGYVGLFSAMGFVVFSRLVWVDVLHFAEPLFPYTQPALFSMPLAFLVAYGVSRLTGPSGPWRKGQPSPTNTYEARPALAPAEP